MKTLTEFSTLTLRRASEARAAKAAEGLEGDALNEALAQALGVQPDRALRLVEALGVAGPDLDLVRLVRVFQSGQGETPPQHATTIGEFHYVVDRVARPSSGRRDRGERRGGGDRDRGERRGGGGPGGGGGGGGGFGGGGFGGGERGPRKPRGLSSFKAGAKAEDDRPDRVRANEVPRAGIGWQLTAAPRDAREDRRGARGPGGPRRDRRDDRRGPRPPRLGPDGQPLPGGGQRDFRGPRPDRGPRLGPDGQPLPPREPRDFRGPRPDRGPRLGPDGQPLPPREPRLGPDGQPLPPREPRLGPDGQPLPPRRGRRGGRGRGGGGGPRPDRGPRPEGAMAPGGAGGEPMNSAPPAPVHAETPPAPPPADKPADGSDTQSS